MGASRGFARLPALIALGASAGATLVFSTPLTEDRIPCFLPAAHQPLPHRTPPISAHCDLPSPRIAWERQIVWPPGWRDHGAAQLGPATGHELAVAVSGEEGGTGGQIRLLALALRSGRILWQRDGAEARVADQRRFYLDLVPGDHLDMEFPADTEAVNGATGRPLWRRHEDLPQWEHPRTGVQDGRLVLFADGRGVIVSAASGRLLRRMAPLPGQDLGRVSPVATSPGSAFFDVGELGMVSLRTGAIVRRRRLTEHASARYEISSARWSPRHGRLFVTDGDHLMCQSDSGLHALRGDLSSVWDRVREDEGGIGSFEIAGNILVADSFRTLPGDDHVRDGLVGLDASTGRTLWHRRTAKGGPGDSDEEVIGAYSGTVVTQLRPGRDGEAAVINAIRAADGCRLWSMPLPAAEGRLYGDLLVTLLKGPDGRADRLRAYYLSSADAADASRALRHRPVGAAQ